MEEQNISYQWIIMADVINSSSYSDIILQENIKKTVEFINKKFKKGILSPLTITLGDEFQGLVKSLKVGIQLIFDMEEYILKENLNFNLRFVFLKGKIGTPINTEIAYGMLGEGLSMARKSLADLKKSDERFEIKTPKNAQSEAINEAFKVYQHILDKWESTSEKEIVSLYLKEFDYKGIALEMGKTRSQIWKREKTLNISSYFAIKKVIFYLLK
jgi:SatD family (SatD)